MPDPENDPNADFEQSDLCLSHYWLLRAAKTGDPSALSQAAFDYFVIAATVPDSERIERERIALRYLLAWAEIRGFTFEDATSAYGFRAPLALLRNWAAQDSEWSHADIELPPKRSGCIGCKLREVDICYAGASD